MLPTCLLISTNRLLIDINADPFHHIPILITTSTYFAKNTFRDNPQTKQTTGATCVTPHPVLDMSIFIDFTTLVDEGFVKLTGPENYNSWISDIKRAATMEGLLGLYLGTQEVVEKPARPDFLEIGNKPAANVPPNWQHHIAFYQTQFKAWQESDFAARRACALLYAAIERWIWKGLSDDDKHHPQRAWDAILVAYKPPVQVRAEAHLLAKLESIKLRNPTAIRPLLAEFEDVYKQINMSNGTCTRAQLIRKINVVLPRKYDFFITYWILSHDDVTVDDEAFKKYRQLLFRYADNYKERLRASGNHTNALFFH